MHRPSMMLNQPWQSNNWLVTNTKSIANHNLNKLIQPHQDSGNWIVSFSCSFLLKFFWSHFYKFLSFLKKGLAWSFHSFSSFVLNGECIVLCDALKGVVVRVEGLKMSLSGRLVDYAALNDGTRGMVPQDQLVVHRETMTKEHLLCMSGWQRGDHCVH